MPPPNWTDLKQNDPDKRKENNKNEKQPKYMDEESLSVEDFLIYGIGAITIVSGMYVAFKKRYPLSYPMRVFPGSRNLTPSPPPPRDISNASTPPPSILNSSIQQPMNPIMLHLMHYAMTQQSNPKISNASSTTKEQKAMQKILDQAIKQDAYEQFSAKYLPLFQQKVSEELKQSSGDTRSFFESLSRHKQIPKAFYEKVKSMPNIDSIEVFNAQLDIFFQEKHSETQNLARVLAGL